MSDNNTTATNETLTPAELAGFLGWSPRFIDGLVRGGKIPHLERDGRVYFLRSEIVEWLERKLQTLDEPQLTELDRQLEKDLLAEGTFRRPRPDRLASRLPLEGIALDVEATTPGDVLGYLVKLADATGHLLQPARVLESLGEREALCSTAMPGGLALCHPRRPLPEAIEKEFVCLLRTREPVDFGAEDGQPTSLFFLLLAPDDRSHLHGLARLARILDADTLRDLRDAADAATVLAIFRDRETSLSS